MNRKTIRLIGIIVVVIALALSGCQKPTEPSLDQQESSEAAQAKLDTQPLTIFTWWTAGGEKEGLDQLIALYEKNNPGKKIIDAGVAGGAGTNAKAVLKTRMLGGDPPGSFQVHGGAELMQTWVKPNLMASLSGF